jgi:phosphosulfolactate synthase
MKQDMTHMPPREGKPRQLGLTMVMDKGLSCRQAEDLIETAGELIDFVKLGFGTSLFTGRVKEKAALYKSAGIRVYAGGTLLEAFLIRHQPDEYMRWIEFLGCDAIEVSDGCIDIPHAEKCDLISRLAKDFYVLSEVGSKDASVDIPVTAWVSMTMDEIEAGSRIVIAEARESGTVGIYDQDGKANTGLIHSLTEAAGAERIMWEAPAKSQQAWFVNLLGSGVNLGNIAPDEVIALETLRNGMRGDTFFRFLNES